jgi:hypothetical protein
MIRCCSTALLFIASALGPAPALAREGCCTSEVEFLGWTRDSRFLAYRQTTTCRGMGGDDGDGGDAGVSFISGPRDVEAVVVEARSGAVEKFDLEIAAKPAAGAKGFAKWRSAHPLAPVQERAVSPDGGRTWLLTGKSGRDLSKVFEDGSLEGLEEETPVSLDIRARGKLWSGEGWTPADCMGNPEGTAFGRWSPDSMYVAWFAEVGTCTYTGGCGEQHFDVHVSRAGPSIQVLADRALLPEALAGARSALERDGYSLISTGVAQDHRVKSVVYARKGMEEAGRNVAAAIPGGATVEPLTWNAPYDLVVALGTAAPGGG